MSATTILGISRLFRYENGSTRRDWPRSWLSLDKARDDSPPID
jgi:hypothetical protein